MNNFNKIIFIFVISISFVLKGISQTDYDKQVEFFANDISKKLPQTKKKIAVIDFKNNNEEITQMTRLVADDISSELAIISNGQLQFEIVERNNLKAIISDLKLSSSKDEAKIAKELGKKSVADVLVIGVVTLFGDNYRISIKVLDTENGNIITASKGLVVKTAALEDLHKKIIENNNFKNTAESTEAPPSNPVVNQTTKVQTDSRSYSTTGWIEFENKETQSLYIYISTEQAVQYRQAQQFEVVSVSSGATEKLPSLKPGIYYICAANSLYSSQCSITKKVEVIAGEAAKVMLKY